MPQTLNDSNDPDAELICSIGIKRGLTHMKQLEQTPQKSVQKMQNESK